MVAQESSAELSKPVRGLVRTVTLFTNPSHSRIDAKVIARQIVALQARDLAGIDRCRSGASQLVVSRCNWLQMIRVYTGTVLAEMIKFHPGRDGPDEHLVGDPMSYRHSAV